MHTVLAEELPSLNYKFQTRLQKRNFYETWQCELFWFLLFLIFLVRFLVGFLRIVEGGFSLGALAYSASQHQMDLFILVLLPGKRTNTNRWITNQIDGILEHSAIYQIFLQGGSANFQPWRLSWRWEMWNRHWIVFPRFYDNDEMIAEKTESAIF